MVILAIEILGVFGPKEFVFFLQDLSRRLKQAGYFWAQSIQPSPAEDFSGYPTGKL